MTEATKVSSNSQTNGSGGGGGGGQSSSDSQKKNNEKQKTIQNIGNTQALFAAMEQRIANMTQDERAQEFASVDLVGSPSTATEAYDALENEMYGDKDQH